MFDFFKNALNSELEDIIFEDFHGAIEEYSKFDYGEEELAAGSLGIKNLPGLKIEKLITYDQREVHRNSCTSEAGNTILSNTFNIDLHLDYRKSKWNQFVKLGADPAYGWYVHKAVDADRKIWNKDHPSQKVATFKIETNSEMFWQLYNKGYLFKYGYKGNSLFNKDRFDGILDEITSENIGKRTYGHSLTGGKVIEMKGADMINIDNYKQRKHNVYGIANFNVSRYSLFFSNSYFYIPESHLNLENVKIKAEKKKTDIIAKELGLWNGLNGDSTIKRQEAAFMFGRLAMKIHDGTLSEEMKKILGK